MAVKGTGIAVGICLGLSTVVLTRWRLLWFALSLGIIVAVMMVSYVAVPARLIGMKTTHSKRDKLTATAVGGVVGAVVCTPPYVLGRVGLVMLGSQTLFIPGIIVFAIGLTLQAGATSAVKAVKMSAKLVSGQQPSREAEALTAYRPRRVMCRRPISPMLWPDRGPHRRARTWQLGPCN